jgi:polysaccharide pyruvyl transferase CsaB
MRIFLIGWFGAGNIGDEAILLSELLSMRSNIKKVRFFILSFNPERTKKLTNDIEEVENIISMGSKHRFLKSDFTGLFRTFKRTDIVIIGGGGIFQDIYNYYPIPFFTLMACMAKIFRKHLMLYSVGIGPVHTAIGKKLCKLTARIADIISVRDSESKELLRAIGVNKEIHVSADPVFLLQPMCSEKIEKLMPKQNMDKRGPVIGICVQNLLFWSEKNKHLLADVLDELVLKNNARIAFLPFGAYHDGWLHEQTPEPVDVCASKEIAGMMSKESAINTDDMNPRALMSIIAEQDLIISMRFHGLVMGIAMGVPVIALTYKDESKISNLMRRIDREDHLFYVDNIDTEKILFRVEHIFSRNDECRRELETKAGILRKDAEKSIELLSDRFLGSRILPA